MLVKILPEQLGQGSDLGAKWGEVVHCPWLHKYSHAGLETKSKPPLHITAHARSSLKDQQARAPFLGGG